MKKRLRKLVHRLVHAALRASELDKYFIRQEQRIDQFEAAEPGGDDGAAVESSLLNDLLAAMSEIHRIRSQYNRVQLSPEEMLKRAWGFLGLPAAAA